MKKKTIVHCIFLFLIGLFSFFAYTHRNEIAGMYESHTTPKSTTSISRKKKILSSSLLYDGLTRTYLVHIPASFQANSASSLLVYLHGAEGSGSEYFKSSNGEVSKYFPNTIAVYPDGTAFSFGQPTTSQQFSWNAGACCGAPVPNKIDDVGFISALMKKLMNQYAISEKHIFLVGHSNGAMLTYKYICSQAKPFVSGAAIISGALLEEDCQTPSTTNLFIVHGKTDKTIPFEGGSVVVPQDKPVVLTIPSVPTLIQFWSKKYDCQTLTSKTIVNASFQYFTNCNANSHIETLTIDGAGHSPMNSEAGNTAYYISTFFAKYMQRN